MKFSRRSVLHATAVALPRPLSACWCGITYRSSVGPDAELEAWVVAVRRLEIPGGLQDILTTSTRTRRRVALCARSPWGLSTISIPLVAGVKGSIASGTDLFIEMLMTSALDEVSTEYGLLAEAVRYPDDYSVVTYRLRAKARWHDGKPISPGDVIYSFDVLKKNSPFYGAYYRHVVKAEKTGEREITFTFDGPGNRELPQIVGQLPVLPKHWWEGTDKSGRKRDITQTTLEPPLGSGPYRLKDFAPGRTLVYEKVDDYWGKDLNVTVGTRNFQTIRYEYFRDSTVALEAFKADQVDWRFENSAKEWANSYDFPAVRDKRVVKEEFPIRNIGVMQGFAFNIRRDKFKDPRVRRAFNFVFDFEEMNQVSSFLANTSVSQATSKGPNSPPPAFHPEKSWKFLRPSGASCRTKCSPSLIQIRLAVLQTPCAATFVRRSRCFVKQATRSRTPNWSMPRPVSHTQSNSWLTSLLPSASCCSTNLPWNEWE